MSERWNQLDDRPTLRRLAIAAPLRATVAIAILGLLAICFVAGMQRDANETASIRNPIIISFLAEIDGWPDSSTRYSYVGEDGSIVWVTLFPGPAAKLQWSILKTSKSLGDAANLLYDLPYDR